MRYPHARVVVLALCPGNDHPTPFFGRVPSVSASRMTALYPHWEREALGVNAWATRSEQRRGAPSLVSQILRETRCHTVVALGRAVQDELGVDPDALLTWGRLDYRARTIDVLRFPHPSGLNRFWNDRWAVDAAAREFRSALDRARRS